jgi:preprotein translocase subunit SecY
MKTIKNILKNKELRNKIFITIFVLMLYKIGTMIKLPTIGTISEQISNASILTLMNYVSGSYLGKFTLFSLGITPYITASIIIQLLGMGVIPAFERWRKEGEKGQQKTKKATMIAAIVLSIIESIILTLVFKNTYNVIKDNSIINTILTAVFLIMGSLLTLFMSRIIDRKGIGNGASLIIFTGIVSRLGIDIYWTAYNIIDFKNLWSIGLFALYLLFFLIIMALVIFIDKSVRKIKIEYAKISNEYSNRQSTMPIKLFLGGVIPVIFTISIMTGFLYLGKFTNIKVFTELGNYQNIYGYLMYAFLIMFFTIYYGKEVFNAKIISDNIKKSNAVVQGKLPGKSTEEFINRIVTHMAIFGGIALVLIASIPILVSLISNTTFNLTLGGTSIMIVAGVAIETMSEIRAKITTIQSKKLSLFD